jgi:hypothetical protein
LTVGEQTKPLIAAPSPNNGQACALAIWRERSHHAENGLRDNRHRSDLEAVQPATAKCVPDRDSTEAE